MKTYREREEMYEYFKERLITEMEAEAELILKERKYATVEAAMTEDEDGLSTEVED